MFARVPGPFFVVIAASGMVRASDMRVLSEFGANSLRSRSQAAFNFRSVASRTLETSWGICSWTGAEPNCCFKC